MEKIYFLLVALLLSQNLLAIDKTWTGSINTDWATASNWSPSGMPTADDAVFA